MRNWIIVAGVAVLVAVGGALMAAANLGAWVTENRDWVGEQAESALGRKVSFGEAAVSWRGGLGVRVVDLKVGDDPAFSKEDFIQAGAVDVRIKIWPALLGDIQVGRVLLRSPSITVIQTRQGMSIDSLSAKPSGSPESAETDAPQPELAVSVALIEVRDGRVRFVDRTASPSAEVTLEQLDFSTSAVRPGAPVAFRLDAAVLGAARQNLGIEGNVGPIGAAAAETALDIELQLDPLPLAEALALPMLASQVPADLQAEGPMELDARAKGTLGSLQFDARIDATQAAVRYGDRFDKAKGVPMHLTLEGVAEDDAIEFRTADLTLADTTVRSGGTRVDLGRSRVEFAVVSDALTLADFGLASAEAPAREELRDLAIRGTLTMPKSGPDVQANVTSADGVARGEKYENFSLDLRYGRQRATIERLAVNALEGAFEVDGYYDLAGPQPTFDLKSTLSDVDVERLVASRSSTLGRRLQGRLAAKLTARGAGSSWDDIKRALTGNGNLVVDDGVLRDVNLAESVISAVTGVPGLSNLVSSDVRARYPELFGVGDTVFEKLDSQIDIRDGNVYARDLRLAARDYVLSGDGRYSLDNALDMSVVLTLSEPLSRDLVASAKGAQYLTGSSGRIEIPVRLGGALPEIRPQPDLRHVSKALQRQLVGGLLDRALGKSAGRDRKPGVQPDAPPAQQAPPEEAAGKLLRKGLDLFGSK